MSTQLDLRGSLNHLVYLIHLRAKRVASPQPKEIFFSANGETYHLGEVIHDIHKAFEVESGEAKRNWEFIHRDIVALELVEEGSVFVMSLAILNLSRKILPPIELTIGPESYFYETDLTIAPDDFMGPLNQNQMTQSDYKNLENLFTAFIANEFIFRFSQKKETFLKLFATLCSRRLGRELITEISKKLIENFQERAKIFLMTGEDCSFTASVEKKDGSHANIFKYVKEKQKNEPQKPYYYSSDFKSVSFIVTLSLESLALQESLKGSIILRNAPPLITLAHELIHLLDMLNNTKLTERGTHDECSIMRLAYTNFEEFRTIIKTPGNRYSENAFREVFDLPRRWGHTLLFEPIMKLVLHPKFETNLASSKYFYDLSKRADCVPEPIKMSLQYFFDPTIKAGLALVRNDETRSKRCASFMYHYALKQMDIEVFSKILRKDSAFLKSSKLPINYPEDDFFGEESLKIIEEQIKLEHTEKSKWIEFKKLVEGLFDINKTLKEVLSQISAPFLLKYISQNVKENLAVFKASQAKIPTTTINGVKYVDHSEAYFHACKNGKCLEVASILSKQSKILRKMTLPFELGESDYHGEKMLHLLKNSKCIPLFVELLQLLFDDSLTYEEVIEKIREKRGELPHSMNFLLAKLRVFKKNRERELAPSSESGSKTPNLFLGR